VVVVQPLIGHALCLEKGRRPVGVSLLGLGGGLYIHPAASFVRQLG
jgi:hypothetical protein